MSPDKEASMSAKASKPNSLDLSDLKRTDKIGLALSGGGFRASLFHIGVLARLAEMDILKHVHVLSTVSGGSIIGAYYYLKIKDLLEGNRKDLTSRYGRIDRDCYVAIIREIETEFLAGVQNNLRVRLLADPISNGKMVVDDEYSRSDRMGDLYDEFFYQSFVQGQNQEPILLKDIKIIPKGEDRNTFDPIKYNQTAEFKVPVLTINATSLNTGNSWHFTSSWIGESEPIFDINTNTVLKFLRLDGTYRSEPGFAPEGSDTQKQLREEKFKQIRLADAVAASACVPGVFKPLAIHDLYWNSRGEEIVVQLVDGGVFDNQGIDALAKADCHYVICSDGSGQIEDELDPVTKLYSVIDRSNSILMKRVREETIENLSIGGINKRSPGKNVIKGWCLLHLRQVCHGDILYPPVPGPADRSDPERVDGHVYRLSNIRTDLDTFTDIEAYTLMYHGYMLVYEGLSVMGGSPRLGWKFLSIAPLISKEPVWLLQNLKIGSQVSFKLISFSPILKNIMIFLGVVMGFYTVIHYAELINCADAILDFVLWTAPGLTLFWAAVALVVHYTNKLPWVIKAMHLFRNYRRQEGNLLTSAVAGLSYPVVIASDLFVRYIDPIFKYIGSI